MMILTVRFKYLAVLVNEILSKASRKRNFEKDLQNKLNFDLSDSSDDDIELNKLRDKIGTNQGKKDEEEEK